MMPGSTQLTLTSKKHIPPEVARVGVQDDSSVHNPATDKDYFTLVNFPSSVFFPVLRDGMRWDKYTVAIMKVLTSFFSEK